jgi:hypothetical protein
MDMTLSFIILYVVKYTVIVGLLVKVYVFKPGRGSKGRSDDDDDGGGNPQDVPLPVYDPPSGNKLEDWLVDRLPQDFVEKEQQQLA